MDLGLRAVVGVDAYGRLGLLLRIDAVGELLEAPLVGLGVEMAVEGVGGLEPLGAGGAVVAAEARQLLRSLGSAVTLEVGGREDVLCGLIDVSGRLLEGGSLEQ